MNPSVALKRLARFCGIAAPIGAVLAFALSAAAQVSPGSLPFAPFPLTAGDCVKALNAYQGQDAGGPCAISGGAGSFTTLTASSTVTFNPANHNISLQPTGSGTVTINPATAGTIDNMAIGATTRSTGLFTTLGLNSTLTHADGSTWGTTGLADSASYSTASTQVFNLNPTWSFSSTGNLIGPFAFQPTLTPAGASAGAVHGMLVVPTAGTSSVAWSALRGITVNLATSAGYTGTITTGHAILVRTPSISGTNPITNYAGINVDPITTNGNAITSGTVTNRQIQTGATTVAAGVGGTLINDAITAAVGSGSSSGTTNRGLYITGNGGGASTNYALYSDSTALSQLAGNLNVPAVSTASGDLTVGATTGNVRVGTGSVPTIASGACGTGANGTIAAGSRSNAGTVQIGASATTVCTVVFAAAMTTAPACTITPANAVASGATVLPYVSSNTVNGFVITGAVLASANFNYTCL